MPPVPELNEPLPVEEMPTLVRRIFFVAAIGSIGLAGLAAYMVRPGLDELFKDEVHGVTACIADTFFRIENLFGVKAAGFTGERDKALIYMAGLPVALCGLVAAVQGWSGLPKKTSRLLAAIGFLANLAVLLGAGIPALLDYLKNT